MKATLILLGGLATASLATGTALAVEPYLPRSPAVFAKLDADSNGRITLQEIQPKAEQRLLRLDADKNREVTAAEIDAYFNRLVQQRRSRILAAMDSDANGVLTVAELDKFVAAMFNGADADKDGGVSLQEARDFKVGAWRKRQQETKAN